MYPPTDDKEGKDERWMDDIDDESQSGTVDICTQKRNEA
jgi:hypothetical protein